MTDLSRRALLALGAALPLSSLARAADDDFQRRAADIFPPLMKAHDIPGLVVGLSREGRHDFFAAGLTARKGGKPVDADTLFELGSVSKTFNVALAALASERGRLALDKPLAEVLPRFKGTAFGALTPINLATHATGGMPLQVPDGVKTDAALMDWLAAWKPAAPPQTRRAYSNISIGMLGRVTASALGTSYTEAAQGTLFPMLGLKGTFIDVPAAARARYAQGYNRANKPVRVTPGLLDAEAYGVKSCARDMLRFLDAHLGTVEVPAELSRALALTRTGYFETARYVQDMVWEQYPWPVGLDRLIAGNSMDMATKPQPITRLAPPLPPQQAVFINKTGSTAGFGAYAVMLPAQRTGLVILANRGYPNGERAKAAYGLIEALAGR
ncbi:Beta-lactamase [Ancylobacter novellus DSM 506]|uniref:Beta-lactamase n=1 Tax=Ancylobacter novellus (strain ATCC 8093 / DSM 506 / JCM 20403 / CCM 1077 / IAM 12100 / NBRC 12443 / NCIMB 10456) TaxID=639283 RepID=D7A3V9_ANCN5|nr:class C beta-lactamase [Ancylobacter novellus]ADH91736.1 Beta-lactamase [Ancylobacter novellus DSM 506]